MESGLIVLLNVKGSVEVLMDWTVMSVEIVFSHHLTSYLKKNVQNVQIDAWKMVYAYPKENVHKELVYRRLWMLVKKMQYFNQGS